MRRITLRQLEVFEAVARLESFTRASEEIFLAQPTVSIQIKKLTEAIGLPLFEQVGKKIFLTDAGKELYQTCESIIEHFSRLEMIASDMKGLKVGKLRLAVTTSCEYFMPRLVGAFSQKYPGIKTGMTVASYDQIIARLTNNKDDFYVMSHIPETIDVVAEKFLVNPFVILAATDHPLVNEKNISCERICKEPFIVRELGSATRKVTERYFSERGKRLKVSMEMGSNEAIKQAVMGRLGLAVLSHHALSKDCVPENLTILDVEGFPIEEYWYVVYLSGKQLSIVAKTFISDLIKHSDLPKPYIRYIPVQKITSTFLYSSLDIQHQRSRR